MDTGFDRAFSAIGYFFKSIGLSGVFEYLFNTFSTVPAIIALLMAALVLSIVAGVAIYALQRREISAHLHALSVAMDEQSRLMEKMRRTLADVMEVLASLETATRTRARTEQGPSPGFYTGTNVSTSALREELELLKAEITAELSADPSAE